MGKKRNPKAFVANDDWQHCLIRLYDLCGFYRDENHIRLKIVASISQLESFLDKYAVLAMQSERHIMQHSELLLLIEQIVATIREQVALYLQVLPEHRSEAIVLCQELERAAAATSGVCLGRSLCTHFQQQNAKEMHYVERLLQLIFDCELYADYTAARQGLQETKECFQRKDLLESLYFCTALDVLNAAQGGYSEARSFSYDHGEIDAARIHKPIDWNTLLQSNTPVTTAVASNRDLRSTLTVEEAACIFLKLEPNALPPATFLLCVGPDGSGKTHLCDKVESLVGSSLSTLLYIHACCVGLVCAGSYFAPLLV
jgi:hypothetical protein